MTHKLNKDQSVAIDPERKWIPIGPFTPVGVRMLLIDEKQGIAYIRQHTKSDQFTHWSPIPTFRKD